LRGGRILREVELGKVRDREWSLMIFVAKWINRGRNRFPERGGGPPPKHTEAMILQKGGRWEMEDCDIGLTRKDNSLVNRSPSPND